MPAIDDLVLFTQVIEHGSFSKVTDNYDLVIRTSYLEDSSLIARHIFNSRWVICASPVYIEHYGKPEKPKDLNCHNCLDYNPQSTGPFDWQFIKQNKIYTQKVSGNFSSDNAIALKKMYSQVMVSLIYQIA